MAELSEKQFAQLLESQAQMIEAVINRKDPAQEAKDTLNEALRKARLDTAKTTERSKRETQGRCPHKRFDKATKTWHYTTSWMRHSDGQFRGVCHQCQLSISLENLTKEAYWRLREASLDIEDAAAAPINRTAQEATNKALRAAGKL